MRVLGISGSLRRDSYNTRLLRAAAKELPPGARLEIFDGLAALPPFDEDAETAPGAAVEEWLAAVAGADALLFATPEYNAGVPGLLKNAVDWASRPFPDNVLNGRPTCASRCATRRRTCSTTNCRCRPRWTRSTSTTGCASCWTPWCGR